MGLPLVLLASLLIAGGGHGHGPRARGIAPLPPAAKVSSFWNRPGRLGPDGFPTPAGMSLYWGVHYREVPSAVTVYSQGGNGKRWPDDRYQLAGGGKGLQHAPVMVVLEQVADPLTDPLADLVDGLAQLAPGVLSVSRQRQYETGGDAVWVDATHLRGGKKAKDRLLESGGANAFVALALKAKTNFYQVAVVERPIPGGEDVALGLFIHPTGKIRALEELVNSLPAGGGLLNLLPH